jgi:hypothetical protein
MCSSGFQERSGAFTLSKVPRPIHESVVGVTLRHGQLRNAEPSAHTGAALLVELLLRVGAVT